MPNLILPHPVNGNLYFGEIDNLPHNGINTVRSYIYLRRGKHTGPNKGFGARHIFAEHHREMAQRGFNSIADVPSYVASILHAGTPLYFEGNGFRQPRILAVKGGAGTSVLQYIEGNGIPIWSVVTAFSAFNRHGQLVGNII